LSWDIDGVPILLPRDLSQSPDRPAFVLMVFRQRDADDLKEWLASEQWNGDTEWLRRYFAVLPTARIVVFEDVRKQLKSGNVLWNRLETLPLD